MRKRECLIKCVTSNGRGERELMAMYELNELTRLRALAMLRVQPVVAREFDRAYDLMY